MESQWLDRVFAIGAANGIETLVVVEEQAQPSAATLWKKARGVLGQAVMRFRVRRDTGPLDTIEALFYFAHTRAAFVAQKKLYGYLKARMGTRYPSMFEDDVFVASINLAKWHVFAACLSDVTVHTVARIVSSGLTAEEGRALASACFEAGLAENEANLPDGEMAAEWRRDFCERLTRVHWRNLAAGGDSFTESPAALYRWAPIEEKLKRYDREIVENSIRFAWAEFIRDFRKRGRPASIAADFLQHVAGGKQDPLYPCNQPVMRKASTSR